AACYSESRAIDEIRNRSLMKSAQPEVTIRMLLLFNSILQFLHVSRDRVGVFGWAYRVFTAFTRLDNRHRLNGFFLVSQAVSHRFRREFLLPPNSVTKLHVGNIGEEKITHAGE